MQRTCCSSAAPKLMCDTDCAMGPLTAPPAGTHSKNPHFAVDRCTLVSGPRRVTLCQGHACAPVSRAGTALRQQR